MSNGPDGNYKLPQCSVLAFTVSKMLLILHKTLASNLSVLQDVT